MRRYWPKGGETSTVNTMLTSYESLNPIGAMNFQQLIKYQPRWTNPITHLICSLVWQTKTNDILTVPDLPCPHLAYYLYPFPSM
jgi:hypothetical protein